ADHEYTCTTQSLIAGEDVGGHAEAGDVPDVARTAGIWPGDADENPVPAVNTVIHARRQEQSRLVRVRQALSGPLQRYREGPPRAPSSAPSQLPRRALAAPRPELSARAASGTAIRTRQLAASRPAATRRNAAARLTCAADSPRSKSRFRRSPRPPVRRSPGPARAAGRPGGRPPRPRRPDAGPGPTELAFPRRSPAQRRPVPGLGAPWASRGPRQAPDSSTSACAVRSAAAGGSSLGCPRPRSPRPRREP